MTRDEMERAMADCVRAQMPEGVDMVIKSVEWRRVNGGYDVYIDIDNEIYCITPMFIDDAQYERYARTPNAKT
jgi:hypothetical protein